MALEIRRAGMVARDARAAAMFETLQPLFERHGATLEFALPPPPPNSEADSHAGEFAGEPPFHTPPPAPEGRFDLLLAVGGDGTVLRAFHTQPSAPVLGINSGTLGFLTAGEEKEAGAIIEALFAGELFIEERLVIESLFEGGSYLVVNEAVVKGATRMVHVDVSIDGAFIHTYRGDGVIVGTPTGSTSFLMSTGSPIVMPRVDCLVLNGINEHRFSARSIVLRGSSVVQLRVNPATRDHEVFLSHDGRDRISLRPGSEITLRRADRPVRILFLDEQYFFRNLKSRLRW